MKVYRHLKIIPLLTAFLIAIPVLAIGGQYKVIRVVDGDTIVVDYQAKHEKVRLLCVNTPESVITAWYSLLPINIFVTPPGALPLVQNYVDALL